MALVVWHIQDTNGLPISGALVQGKGDNLGTWEMATNDCGDSFTDLGADNYFITVTHPDFDERIVQAIIKDCGIITIGLMPVSVILKPILAKPPIFVTDDGIAWRWKFVSAFKLAQRWNDGEDLSPFLNWIRALGANGVRVFLQHCYLDSCAPDWPPVKWQMPINKVHAFAEWIASKGFYCELTVLADCEEFGQSDDDQVDRVNNVLGELVGTNTFVEICNEPEQNACNPVYIANSLNLFNKRPQLMSLGLYPVTGSEPNFPVLDYLGDHPARKTSWPAECGKTGYYQYEQTRAVCISDEPPKFSEPGADPEATEQSWELSPDNAEDAGGGFGIGSAGATFHCRSGIDTVRGGELETACATKFFAAMDNFPADSFTGIYGHDGRPPHGLKATTEAGEVASRTLSTTQYVACAQPTSKWVPEPIDGWKIEWRKGNRGTMIKLIK